jgi:hypothetical protein
MEDDEGRITRRFVHRTVLEHLVAEHITTLEADEAARILLPHLWFDPDWKVVAPAAIAAHNRRQRGALLRQLSDKVVHPAKDPARQAASRELDKLLAAATRVLLRVHAPVGGHLHAADDPWLPHRRAGLGISV